MNLFPSDYESLLMRFDSFCKKVLKRKNYTLLAKEHQIRNRECTLSEINENAIDKFYITDKYNCFSFLINLDEVTVAIENEMLYEALMLLSERRLEIILLSYFMDMTDKEISEKIEIPKSTVQYNRNAALRHIKKIMEDKGGV